MAEEENEGLPANAAGGDIMHTIQGNPRLALLHEITRTKLYEHIDLVVSAHQPDLSTQKGRDAIASLAFKITRTKTAIEKEAVKLRADVQANKESLVVGLDERATKARKPLTDWEEEEKRLARIEAERVAKVDAEMERLRQWAQLPFKASSEEIAERRRALDAYEIDSELFRDTAQQAENLKELGLIFLSEAIETAERDEEAAAELARLKAEALKREEEEAERRRQEEAKRQAEEPTPEPEPEPERMVSDARKAELDAQGEAIVAALDSAEEEEDRTSDFEISMENQVAPSDVGGDWPKRIGTTTWEDAPNLAAPAIHKAEDAVAEAAQAIADRAGVSIATATLIVGLISNGEIPHLAITL